MGQRSRFYNGPQNDEVTLFASAARTATVDSAEQENAEARGVHVIIDVTVDPAAASIVAKIQGKDPASGKWHDILEATAITAVGTTVLKIYPGIPVVAGGVASDILPKTWRVRVEHADGDSITYSVGAAPVI